MNFARSTNPVALADGRVLVPGHAGLPGELYDPVANDWKLTPPISTDIEDSSQLLVALKDGRALMIGGGRWDGNGYTAVSSVLYTPDTTVAAEPLTFADQTPGTAATATVSITNTGGTLLTISDLRLSGHPDFSLLDHRCGEAIAPRAPCTVTVRFTPSAVAESVGELSFSANTDAGAHRIALRGRGIGAGRPLPAPGTDGSAGDRCPGLAGPASRLGCPTGLLADPSIAYQCVKGGIRVVAYYVKATTGARVVVRCSKGCKPTVTKGKGSRRVRIKALDGRRLANGTRITITVTAPGRLTTTVRDRITRGRRVEGRPRCTIPGGSGALLAC